MAIGLQNVDRLKPSEFLLAYAKANIEGILHAEEVGKRLEEYYSERSIQQFGDCHRGNYYHGDNALTQ